MFIFTPTSFYDRYTIASSAEEYIPISSGGPFSCLLTSLLGEDSTSADARKLAEAIVAQYGGSVHLVEASVGADGSIGLVWDDDRGNYAYLDVGPGETVHLYFDTRNYGKWEGVAQLKNTELCRKLRLGLEFTQERNAFFQLNKNDAIYNVQRTA